MTMLPTRISAKRWKGGPGARRSSRRNDMLGRAILWAAGLMALAVLLPFGLVDRLAERPPATETGPGPAPPMTGTPEGGTEVRVYLAKARKIESVPLEHYVRGVLAAEMPADFELEALKAQAIAARTYIVRRLRSGDTAGVPEGADVTDTVAHQAYIPLDELAKRPERTIAKLNQAVNETRDQVITYQGEPIMAAFFSTSNGYTENAEDYWKNPVPYLKSVPSPWDQNESPRYAETAELPLNEVLDKLGLTPAAVPGLAQAPRQDGTESSSSGTAAGGGLAADVRILSRTAGKRVEEVQFGSKRFSGRDIREKLNLRSSAFDWERDGDKLRITTYGYGHGVGMSQYGAQGMAKQGAGAERILTYYYTGVQLDKASKLLTAADRPSS
ncbi:stage II sporulation protein D [Paenibacillus melissococcoides]|uniref:Stage II sporulation protein D n=1 Tax=Paenibacillus melissococcoides TaxID=2912268 RepID=A0ABM9G9U9_9BACL|nr:MULTISPECIES: stage II sporulation protein D [Paenibacillus]GIO78412.1 stage II sporulation protein D [Paenibacillus dendritiformis]CAH8248732.1 stage II sporulation protein D [Paenibacillus melissococcoides]CAH8713896.1 stage II sporulation protein D [Paenibacillus melissococcoides]CAH8720336.1 stage II sporulation protein D [Paenibacillus melissococcoides]